MKKVVLLVTISVMALHVFSQKPSTDSSSAPKTMAAEDKSQALKRSPAAESLSVTKGEVSIKGQRVPYKTSTGTLPVWDEDGKPIASIFYVYYERSDVSDRNARPLVISFNGGPGSASLWMQIGYTGPRILKIDDEGYPVQPYGMKDNPNSILDVADIVYIDPVNTGFSRILDKATPSSKFFGVNADIKYLAEWINTFLSRYKRWASPKFLIGESYGTTRVAGLSLELQNNQWIFLNGVILVSPTELGIEKDSRSAAALRLPYYAATAWYHKALPADLQKKDLTELLPEVEQFAVNEYLPAMHWGGAVSDAKRKELVGKIARYSGLSEKAILQNNLDVPSNFFWKELLRDKGYTIGRLDSRYLGIDRKDAGIGPDYNAELISWEHSFTPAINMYLRDELNYKTDLKYNVFGSVYPWDNNNDKTGYNLAQAMAENPYLHVLVQSGYYDGSVCDYFNAKYSIWQMDPSGKFKDRMSWEGYRSGHMMYLRKEDLATSNEHLRQFIKKATPKSNQPAKY